MASLYKTTRSFLQGFLQTGVTMGTLAMLTFFRSRTRPMSKAQKREEGQSRNGTDSQSVVSTRSPSPTSSNGDGEPPDLQSKVLPYHFQVSNVPPSPERT